MRSILVLLLTFFCWFHCISFVFSSDPKAVALLKGLENSRTKYNCFQLYLTEIRSDEGNVPVRREIDYDHGKIRTEFFPGEGKGSRIAMLFDDEYIDVNSKRTDVRITSKTSIQARASNLFDPRLLGVTDIYILDAGIKDCCLYRFDDILVETVILDGKKVNRVYRKDGENSWEMFIEEPGFRLLKVIDTSPPLKVTVVNEYDNDNYGPFPKRSSMLREQDGKNNFFVNLK